MIGLVLSYLTALKFWMGVLVGSAIGWQVLKQLVARGYAWIEKKV
jgi:hypothetical protein